MALISKKFTFNLPDEYLSQTDSLGLTAEWQYDGPDKIYVLLDPNTKTISENSGFLPYDDTLSEEENNAFMEQFSGVNKDYALITFEGDPLLLAAVIGTAYGLDISKLPQKTYTLEGETEPFYSRPDPTTPNHTIEVSEAEWDGTSWKKPYPWKKPYITKEQLLSALDTIIKQEKKVDTSSFTSTQKTKWAAYLSELENVPTRFATYLDSPWMVPFPPNPMWSDNWSASKGNFFGNDNKAGEQKVEKPEGPIEYIDGKAYRDSVEVVEEDLLLLAGLEQETESTEEEPIEQSQE
jgi:hypothetical protein